MSSAAGADTTRSSSEATAPVTTPVSLDSKLLNGGTKDFGFLHIPQRLQYDATRPFKFTPLLNITFGFASTFSKPFSVLLNFQVDILSNLYMVYY